MGGRLGWAICERPGHSARLKAPPRGLHLVALRMASPSTSKVGGEALQVGGEVNGGRRLADAAFMACDRDG